MANWLDGPGTGPADSISDARTTTGRCPRRCRRADPDGPRDECPDDYASFLRALRAELAPRGVLEGLLVDQVGRAAWHLRRLAPGGEDGGDEPLAPDSPEVIAARSLLRALATFEAVKWRRADADAAYLGGPDPSGSSDDDEVPSSLWRGRLVFDPDVSEVSPVVKGTWVTVRHVLALIVDGWTWADILRAHPELSSDDIRACLAYSSETAESAD